VFTVANFYIIFNSIFWIILTKIVENELKMKSKMSQKWPKNGYREQPYCKERGAFFIFWYSGITITSKRDIQYTYMYCRKEK
jgi:hypothetical protein